MTHSIRTVAVVGAGIGGLMSALALSRFGIRTLIFERDTPPPINVPPADSMTWRRKGVPQSLHPHFFMGRLRVLLEQNYPDLIEALLEGGAGENRIEDYVHPSVRQRFHPSAEDERLRSLNARRTTFEMIVRERVRALPTVEIRDKARALDLLIDDASAPCTVKGLRIDAPGGPEIVEADAVIDASGRFSKLAEQLARAGVHMDIEQEDSGIWYLTRHYRLRPGCRYPSSSGLPGAQFADFIVGALPADNGAFTVTFQIYQEDRDIVRALRDPEHFQAMCTAVGAIAPWVDPQTAEPTSDVYGFGQMDSFWRHTVLGNTPQVLNYYCVGDSGIRSNPKFGRGCTWTAVAAHRLAQLLADSMTPSARIRRYEQCLREEFRTDWETMLDIDRRTRAGFEIAAGRRSATARGRVGQWFESLVNRAMATEPDLFREIWRGYHGFTNMSAWLHSPRVWPRLLRAALLPNRDLQLQDAIARRPNRDQLANANLSH